MKIKRDILDILFSRYIRLKAKGICCRCLQYKGYEGLQVAHFWGRRYRSIRFDESNVCPLCFSCHQYFHENPLEYVEFFRKYLGEEGFDLLQARMRQIGKIDREAIRLYLQEEIKKLEKGEGQ